jgi:hypothetical protein
MFVYVCVYAHAPVRIRSGSITFLGVLVLEVKFFFFNSMFLFVVIET